jgi:hypothetical protein
MPVNYQQIQQKVKQIGQMAPAEHKKLLERRAKARDLLVQHAFDLEKLSTLFQRALALNSALRCAIPGSEALTYRGPVPLLDTPIVLLAADGSQINPDRHASIEFGVINTGAIRILPGRPEAPQEIIETKMLYGDELQTESGPVTEEIVAMRRDRDERTLLAKLAAVETLPVVTLTDGQLELFREPQQAGEFTRLFTEFQEALRELARMGAVTAGYVDKPRADLVVRLLELLMLPDGEFSQAGRLHPLAGVDDAMLFGELLQPGERSAVFGIQSRSAEQYDHELALHFFFINVGRPERPWLARVEMPAWVAESPVLLDRLQAALVEQCRQLGSKPYPYALHRAHEVAVVRMEEKEQLENMLILELMRQGVEIGAQSNKQYSKDISGNRTRYT